MEIWLHTNVRALLFGTILPLAVALVGIVLLLGFPDRAPPIWLRGAGAALLVFGAATGLALLWQIRQPRLAYRDRQMLVWLRSGPPLGVPIEAVECFWLGQAPTLLPGQRDSDSETASVVIRIADSAPEWRHQEVKPQLGTWCEGYITIRGTWCEPLGIDLINRLNRRLAEVNRTVPK